jgi:hypothetical protein
VLTAMQAVALPIRIQPLGDSITIGGPGQLVPCVSYRYPLFERLATAGIDFDFVGSVIDWNSYPIVNGTVFPDHYEGHWGYKIEEINAGLAGWMSTYELDWSLILLGTNRIVGESAGSLALKMSTTIDLLREKNPNVVIFLGLPYQTDMAVVATAFARLAMEKTTEGSPVIPVGPPEGWSSSVHTYDGGHPNAAGAELLAATWFDAIQSHLNAGSTRSRSTMPASTARQPIEITRLGETCLITLPVQQARIEIMSIAGRLVSSVNAENGRALLSGNDLSSQVRLLRVRSAGYTATVPLWGGAAR